MELGLSLGDTPPSNPTNQLTTKTATSNSLGFCMALGMNPLNGSTHEPQAQDCDDVDNDEYDEDDDDHEHNLKERSVGAQRITSLNPPVQLDLLPSAPVPRHTSFPWSSDNGSSEGGSSGNAAARRGLTVVTEEATSSFRLDFMSYRRIGNNDVNGDGKNDVVEVERASSRASDEDDNGISRKKLRLSKVQSAYLEESFKEHNTLNPKQKLALAERLNLRPRQVEVWFQNRRARTKLKQTEVDYEYLKRCCETLTDENRRLHKELQELRALKTTSNPFYMQRPATTLTMCPSCERVAMTSTTPPLPSSTTLTNNMDPSTNKTSTTQLTLSAKSRSLTPTTSQQHPHE
nr:homeobox-leucine zipper protein HOX11-like [Tanacetum cinerariifolium]